MQAIDRPRVSPVQGDVLIRAENGDVITFDDTGLTLRLSDTVLADLRRRLALSDAIVPDLAECIGDIDGWGLRRHGDWYHFTARLSQDQPPRDYQRRVDGGDIIAAAPGPLYGLLSIGGPRRAGFNSGPTRFANHILAPGDDIGAVGCEGTDLAQATSTLQHVPHASRDALIAQTLLDWRYESLRGLPLFMVRCETDGTMRLADLPQGRAYANFKMALANLVAAARDLGKRPRVLAVSIDLTLEDIKSTPTEYAQASRALMSRIERDMAALGLQRPIFLMTAEAGTQKITEHPATLAQWELAWLHGDTRLALTAPGYMFAQTRFGRPTDEARLRMAEMDAHAIVALSQRQDWLCPLPLLAEYDGARIKVTLRSLLPLVIEDRFNAGPACGFSVTGSTHPVKVLAVAIDPSDPKALIVTCDAPPTGAGVQLCYAYASAVPSPDDHPANRGAIRDEWAAESQAAGGLLHRWALPCQLALEAV